MTNSDRILVSITTGLVTLITLWLLVGIGMVYFELSPFLSLPPCLLVSFLASVLCFFRANQLVSWLGEHMD